MIEERRKPGRPKGSKNKPKKRVKKIDIYADAPLDDDFPTEQSVLNDPIIVARGRQVLRTCILSLLPPSTEPLSKWMEEKFRVVNGPYLGPWRPWKFQIGIADAIGDPYIETVSILKSTRVGYTTILSGYIASLIDRAPCQIIMLQPTDSDCRDYVVSQLEPALEAVESVRGVLEDDDVNERQTITSKIFPGGSLKILAARSPRNLRRHGAKVMIFDEADAMEVTADGDPIQLGIGRTLEYADRKIIIGSSPSQELISHVWPSWLKSDQRVYEVPCPKCSQLSEIFWEDIVYPANAPEKAEWKCPKCQKTVAHRYKAGMVEEGGWRVTVPGNFRHAGFRVNALISPHSNASWGILAKEYEDAKREGPAALQVFVNTKLGLPWSTNQANIDTETLISRVESHFGYIDGRIVLPSDVLCLTAGVDTQDYRLEVTLVGWSRIGQTFVVDHHSIDGSPHEEATWTALDRFINTEFIHPWGGKLSISATAVDAGGHATQRVLDFCHARVRRNVWAIFGRAGPRPIIERTKSKKGNGMHLLIGVEKVKEDIFDKLKNEPEDNRAIRFGAGLERPYFDGLTAEQPMLRYVRGVPIFEWRRVRERNEPLDCLVYGSAVRKMVARFDPDEIERTLRVEEFKPKPIARVILPPQQPPGGVSPWLP